MKNLCLYTICLLLCTGTLRAQENPSKSLKQANKMLGKYNLDPESHTDAIFSAADHINVALTDEKLASTAKVWLTKGKIFNEISARNVVEIGKNAGFQPTFPNAPFQAYEALIKTDSLSDKKYEKSEVYKGLRETAVHLNQMGVFQFGNKNYKDAYSSFNTVLLIRELLNSQEIKEVLSSRSDFNEQLMRVGISAMRANMIEEADPVITQLYEAEYDDPFVFEAKYAIANAKGDSEAIRYLNKGLEKYPQSQVLQYAAINSLLKQGKYDEVKVRLEKSIKSDPKNKSLYLTLGNVHDNLFQKSMAEGKKEMSQIHFDEALKLYNKALELDPNLADALYNAGALYYNRAAKITGQMQEIESDYSKEGIRNYETLKAEVFRNFDLALPYFIKAEIKNPNDRNTLTALKEIFAKKDDIILSNEFKTRLETVLNNGKVNSSYFKKN